MFSVLSIGLSMLLKGVVSVAIGYGAFYLRKKLGNEAASSIVHLVDRLAQTVVSYVDELFAKKLKERNGGKLSDKEAKELKTMAVNRLVMMMGPKQLKKLKTEMALTDKSVNSFLSTVVEDALGRHKAWK